MEKDKGLTERAEELVAALREEEKRHPDVWLYRDAADLIAALQAENARLTAEAAQGGSGDD